MDQNCILILINKSDYAYDAEVAAQSQMNYLKDDIVSIKNYQILGTEAVSDHLFETKVLVTYIELTPENFEWEIKYKNPFYLNDYKLEFNTF